jgi:hypothetical protein
VKFLVLARCNFSNNYFPLIPAIPIRLFIDSTGEKKLNFFFKPDIILSSAYFISYSFFAKVYRISCAFAALSYYEIPF